MNETVSSEAEQGEAITINQETQDLVLPADLVVAHQLIAVQQSSMDVQWNMNFCFFLVLVL